MAMGACISPHDWGIGWWLGMAGACTWASLSIDAFVAVVSSISRSPILQLSRHADGELQRHRLVIPFTCERVKHGKNAQASAVEH